MSRKTHTYTLAAIVAVTGLTFASSDFSGAVAQDNGDTLSEIAESTAKQAVAPQYVSQEIVQAVPEQAEEAAPIEPQSSASSLRELVGQTSTDFVLSDEMQCLAGAVYFEARGEPLDGQLAVAQVVINRSADRRFPDSYCGVVYQRAQFSFVKGGRMPRIATSSSAWQRAKAIARIAHEAQWQSEAEDSLYFHAKYVRPSWSRKKVARATISSHIFYR